MYEKNINIKNKELTIDMKNEKRKKRKREKKVVCNNSQSGSRHRR